MSCAGLWRVLSRRKVLDNSSVEKSPLARILTIGDLTALGVGSTLGVGVYVLAGNVAKESAGPSVVLSFLLAAIASIFAGLCYAEFGARLPRAGSAYVYSYVCVGEFVAFIIGWNLILEYVIGSASVSRGISLYLDSLLNNTMKNSFKEIMPVSGEIFSDYFDIFAFGLSLFIGFALAFGLKESSLVNNIFTLLNIFVVIFVIGAGAFKASIENWELEPSALGGNGGFFPFGFSGTLKGAATCFFGFVGFDCIATTGEEVKNPRKAIPVSIICSLLIIFLSYFGVSAILTLMVPYYLQNSDAPLPAAFEQVGFIWAKWIVAIGGMFGLFASLFGSMFPLPRILYAMASDGLIFNFLGSVNSRFKTPIFGTIFASLITGTMAGLFELKNLVNMMSIGTLMAYTIVAACVLLLRYVYDEASSNEYDEYRSLLHDGVGDHDELNQEHKSFTYHGKIVMSSNVQKSFEDENHSSEENIESFYLSNKKRNYSINDFFRQLFSCNCNGNPTKLSSMIVSILITVFFVFSLSFSLCLSYMWEELLNGVIWSIVITSIFGCLMIITVLLIFLQPRNKISLSFQVPLVPFLPALSIFINIYLMLMLDANTWIRFGVWMAIGIPVYLICLCIYNRGPNYEPNVQKSSVNGHMKGNLNIAFENECQQLENNFDNNLNFIEKVPVPLSIEDNKFETRSNHTLNENNSIYDMKNEDVTNIDEMKAETNGLDNKSYVENVEDSLDYGVQIIEMLDQVLKDEEEASGGIIDTYEINDTINSSYPINQFDDENFSNQEISIETINDDSTLDKISMHNVIAIVHREDESVENDVVKDDNDMNEIVETNTSEPLDDKNNELEIQTIIPEIIEDTSQTYLPEPSQDFFIPKPPPMDDSLFSAPIIHQFKSKTVNLKKTPAKSLIENEQLEISESSVDDSSIKITKDFQNKLSNLYINYGTNPQVQRRLTKGAFVESSTDYKNAEKSSQFKRNNSEPNIAILAKLDSSNDKSFLNDGESLNLRNNSDVDKKNILNGNNQIKIIDKDALVYDHEDEPKSIADIKAMLNKVLVNGPIVPKPKQQEVKIPKNYENHESDPELVEDKIILPKSQPDYTKTMKMQRAKFGNVLKSIELIQSKRESLNSGNIEMNHNSKNDISGITNNASNPDTNSDR